MPHQLFTIGYCVYSLDNFISTLRNANVNAVVDVRASPEISHFHEYKGRNISLTLKEANIHYLSFARELGARPQDKSLYTDGKVDFGKMEQSGDFQSGCTRLKQGMDKGYRICLMCAQKDPLNCHRGVLIANIMRKKYPELKIMHIWPDFMESQQDLDKRALKIFKKERYASALLSYIKDSNLPELDQAYAYLGEKIAYRPEQGV